LEFGSPKPKADLLVLVLLLKPQIHPHPSLAPQPAHQDYLLQTPKLVVSKPPPWPIALDKQREAFVAALV